MTVTLGRVLFFIAFACGLIAALSFAGSVSLGPPEAWLAGGFAAWWLGQAVG